MAKLNSILKTALLSLMTICLISAASCSGPDKPVHKADYDVIIIGGGLAGLSAAAQLANRKMKVLLLEQHYKVGGCATNFTRGKYTFDVALHEMDGAGPKRPGRKSAGAVQQLLKECGMLDKVQFIEHKDLYRSIYPGVDVTLPANWEGFKKVLKEKWPEEAAGIDKFQKLCTAVYNEGNEISEMYRSSPIKAFFTKILVPFRQRTLFSWMDKTVKDLMDECFKGKEIKAVVSQYWCYLGPPIAEQSALIYMMAMDSYAGDGAWHIKGSSQALSDAYAARIRELGGTIKTESLVTKITMEDGTARGVETEDGEKFTSRYIVANTDPYQLVDKLVGEEHFPGSYIEKIRKLKPANSLFGVYLGLNIDLKARGYKDYEYFYSPSFDNKKMHDKMMKGDYKDGTLVIAIYTNMDDPVYAAKGRSVIKLDAYADIKNWPADEEEYKKLKEKKMDELIALAANVIPELKNPKYIDVREGYTPRTLQTYTLNKGGIVYGYAMTPEHFDRIPNNTPIDNVFIASNWTQLSHGYSGCQINGWQAARLIMDIEGMD